MSDKVLFLGKTTSIDVWKGHASVNREGVALAVEMLDQLAEGTPAEDGADVTVADYSSLEDWPRHGRPFRNVVVEYLTRAREAGSDVEAGFCAVLSDMAALVATGVIPDIGNYAEMYGIDDEEETEA